MSSDSVETSKGAAGLACPDLPKNHPQNVPLDEWTDGWLKLSIAGHLGVEYVWMNEAEKQSRGLPSSKAGMVAFLIEKGDVPAAGATRGGGAAAGRTEHG